MLTINFRELNKVIIHINLIIISLGGLSCNHSTTNDITEFISSETSIAKKEYPKWVESKENGLNNLKIINKFNYEIQYKPIEYILAKKNYDSLKVSDYDNLHYIDLKLSHEDFQEYLKIDLVEQNDYYHRLKYFSFEIQNDVQLIDGNDTLKCIFSHFERTYGITPYIKIVMAFEKNIGSKNDLYFSYHDQVFNNGIIILPVKNEALKNIPQIKMKNNG